MKRFKLTSRNLPSLLTEDARRTCLEEGDFGAISPYTCDKCGPVWEEPENVCTYRGCGFENYWGPEPAEYEDYCSSCGRSECCGENENGGQPFKILSRYKVSIKQAVR